MGAAPGGYDIFCQQRIATLASYRPLYQAVLDAELTLMAEVAMRLRNQFNAKPRQLRVDGCVIQVSRKQAKRLLEWREEARGKFLEALMMPDIGKIRVAARESVSISRTYEHDGLEIREMS